MTPLFRLILPRGIAAGRQGRYLAFNRFLVDGPAYGGLVGSAADAARFMAAHLRGGELDGVRLLSAEGVLEMQTHPGDRAEARRRLRLVPARRPTAPTRSASSSTSAVAAASGT